MAVSVEQVRLMAQAFVESIGQMTAKEKDAGVRWHFGKRFNDILQLAREVAPEVDARLWPQPLTKAQYYDLANSRYAEISTYSGQIIALLNSNESAK